MCWDGTLCHDPQPPLRQGSPALLWGGAVVDGVHRLSLVVWLGCRLGSQAFFVCTPPPPRRNSGLLHVCTACTGGSTERIRGPTGVHWVLGPLSVDEHRWHATWAPGLAPRVPDPLCALVAPENSSGPQWWSTGCWVPWAQADRDQGWPSGCPIPCVHSPLHVTPQGPWWPTGRPISRPSPLWGH